jgi:hypothetical protein
MKKFIHGCTGGGLYYATIWLKMEIYHNEAGSIAACFMLISCLDYSSILTTESTCYSQTSIDFRRTARDHIAEGTTLHIHRFENLKSSRKMCPLLQVTVTVDK